MPRSSAARPCSWSTSWRTPMRPAGAIPSAGRTSRNCWPPASTCYTTVNVQHIESLNDIVGGITGIRVCGDRAGPRVRQGERGGAGRPAAGRSAAAAEGRQGLPAGAGRARDPEFLPQGQPDRAARAGAAPDRRSGRRPDARVPPQQCDRGAVWQTRDTLLACIGPSDVRRKGGADRGAPRRQARCDLACGVRGNAARCSVCRRRSGAAVLGTLKLAQELGAETATLPGAGRGRGAARVRAPPQSRPHRGRAQHPCALARWPGRQPFSRRLGAQRAGHRPDRRGAREDRARPAARDARSSRRRLRGRNGGALRGYLYAVLDLRRHHRWSATPLQQYFELANIVMLFLLGVVFIAYRFGRGPAVLAALLSVAAVRFLLRAAASDLCGQRRAVPAHVRGHADRRPGHRSSHRRPALPGARGAAVASSVRAACTRWPGRCPRPLVERAGGRSSATSSSSRAFAPRPRSCCRISADRLQAPAPHGGTPGAMTWRGAMVLRPERTGRRRHRYAAGDAAALSAAQGADAGARRAGDRAEQCARC